MADKPVLSAPHPLHTHRSTRPVGDDCETTDIQPKRELMMLEGEAAGEVGHVLPDPVEVRCEKICFVELGGSYFECVKRSSGGGRTLQGGRCCFLIWAGLQVEADASDHTRGRRVAFGHLLCLSIECLKRSKLMLQIPHLLADFCTPRCQAFQVGV